MFVNIRVRGLTFRFSGRSIALSYKTRWGAEYIRPYRRLSFVTRARMFVFEPGERPVYVNWEREKVAIHG